MKTILAIIGGATVFAAAAIFTLGVWMAWHTRHARRAWETRQAEPDIEAFIVMQDVAIEPHCGTLSQVIDLSVERMKRRTS